jgi:hypothetical protein
MSKDVSSAYLAREYSMSEDVSSSHLATENSVSKDGEFSLPGCNGNSFLSLLSSDFL